MEFWQALRGSDGTIREVFPASNKVRLIGFEVETMVRELRAYAENSGHDLEVLDLNDPAQDTTEVVFLFKHSDLARVPGAVEVCGSHCDPQEGRHFWIASIAEMGWFRRESKIVFINLAPLLIDNTLGGDRYACVMERVVQEVKQLIVVDDPCKGKFPRDTVPIQRQVVKLSFSWPWRFSTGG